MLAERILCELKATPMESGGEEFYISCSMGSATFPETPPVITYSELLKLADQALYAAKRAGRAQLAQWHLLTQEHRDATFVQYDPTGRGIIELITASSPQSHR